MQFSQKQQRSYKALPLRLTTWIWRLPWFVSKQLVQFSSQFTCPTAIQGVSQLFAGSFGLLAAVGGFTCHHSPKLVVKSGRLLPYINLQEMSWLVNKLRNRIHSCFLLQLGLAFMTDSKYFLEYMVWSTVSHYYIFMLNSQSVPYAYIYDYT